jgi:hypothetical protein
LIGLGVNSSLGSSLTSEWIFKKKPACACGSASAASIKSIVAETTSLDSIRFVSQLRRNRNASKGVALLAGVAALVVWTDRRAATWSNHGKQSMLGSPDFSPYDTMALSYSTFFSST